MTAFIADTLQQQIERGEVFVGYYGATLQYDTSHNAIAEIILISTGAEEASVFFGFKSMPDDTLNVQFWEGVTTSADGTSLPLENMNRGSAVTTNIAFYHTPTITDNGTLVYAEQIFGETVPSASPFNKEAGFILAANTKYQIRLLAAGQSENIVTASYFSRDVT